MPPCSRSTRANSGRSRPSLSNRYSAVGRRRNRRILPTAAASIRSSSTASKTVGVPGAFEASDISDATSCFQVGGDAYQGFLGATPLPAREVADCVRVHQAGVRSARRGHRAMRMSWRAARAIVSDSFAYRDAIDHESSPLSSRTRRPGASALLAHLLFPGRVSSRRRMARYRVSSAPRIAGWTGIIVRRNGSRPRGCRSRRRRSPRVSPRCLKPRRAKAASNRSCRRTISITKAPSCSACIANAGPRSAKKRPSL